MDCFGQFRVVVDSLLQFWKLLESFNNFGKFETVLNNFGLDWTTTKFSPFNIMLYEIFVKQLVSAILDDIVEYICMTYHCEIELVLLFRREVTTAHSFADFEFSSSLKIALTRSLIDVVV